MRALVCILALVAVARLARAEDAIVRGRVIKVEAKEIYVDLGGGRGIIAGAALRIKRTITLRHPVTHAPVQDWIPIGSASVTAVGAVMSRAVVGDLVSEIRAGDVAEILVIGAEPAAPIAPAAPTAAAPPVDPATAEVLALFAAQAGQPLEARIAGWEHYLSTRPGSPYADGIRRELDSLHALLDQLHPQTVAHGADVLTTVQHAPLDTAVAGTAIPVVFVLDKPQQVASAYLHYRQVGDRTYRSLLLAREHDIYLRGVVPAEVVQPPGVDYFVEVSTPTGHSGLALGTPSQPISVEVPAPAILDRFASRPGRSSVKLDTDYLDFASFDKRAGDHRDWMVASTVDFTYRLDHIVESLGVGYGVYAGAGGYANQTWDPMNPIPRSGFDYGYMDAELGGHTDAGVHLSVGGQLIAGVGRQGFGMGVEGRFRIGDRDATNLLLSARTIDQVGTLSLIRFGTRLAQRLLFGVSVAATDQPNQGDLGVRLGSDVEVIGSGNVSVLLHGSWQGRSIDHGGLGGGAGLGVYW
jgi:hypothetical protein